MARRNAELKTRAAARKKQRTCLRCRCTDSRACAGGCVWLHDSVDICSKCVRPAEVSIFALLHSMDCVLTDIAALPDGVPLPHRCILSGSLISSAGFLINHLTEGKQP